MIEIRKYLITFGTELTGFIWNVEIFGYHVIRRCRRRRRKGVIKSTDKQLLLNIFLIYRF